MEYVAEKKGFQLASTMHFRSAVGFTEMILKQNKKKVALVLKLHTFYPDFHIFGLMFEIPYYIC